MPCRDPRDLNSFDNSKRIKELETKLNYYTAGLCALITEVKKINKTDSIYGDTIIERASKLGKFNFETFFKEHEKEDVDRLKKVIKKLSQHEIDLILKYNLFIKK